MSAYGTKPHPLAGKVFTGTANWSEFLKQWDTEDNLDKLYGLLYTGLRVKFDEGKETVQRDERILFYLRVMRAYRLTDDGRKAVESAAGENRPLSFNEARSILETKAEVELRRAYFTRLIKAEHDFDPVTYTKAGFDVLEALFEYFVVDKKLAAFDLTTYPEKPAVSIYHRMYIHAKFAERLAIWTLKYQNPAYGGSRHVNPDESSDWREKISSLARSKTMMLQALKILGHLNRTNLLLSSKFERLQTPVIRDALLQASLEGWDRDHPHDNIDAAVRAGNSAARTYLVFRELIK